jgi:hypothetical protein
MLPLRIFRATIAVSLSIFAISCNHREGETFETSKVVGDQGGLIESIDGISVSFPHSESLSWKTPLDSRSDF